MTKGSKFHQKPFTVTGAIVFLLIGLLHALRVILGAPVVVGGYAVPLWASYPGAAVAILLAVMLWRENFKG